MLFPACAFTETGTLPKLPPTPVDKPVTKPVSAPSPAPSKVPSRDKLFPKRNLALTPDEINNEITTALEKEESFPQHAPIKLSIGKTMLPCTYALTHPATELITDWGINPWVYLDKEDALQDQGQPLNQKHQLIHLLVDVG